MTTKSVAHTHPIDWYDNAPKHVSLALELLGTKEWAVDKGKTKSNPVVLQMFEDVGHPEVKSSIKTPWCAAFIGAMLKRAGYAQTGSLMARSYLKWGKETEDPRLGDVAVFWRGKRDDGVTGHVAFFVKRKGDWIYHISGNDGDAVSEGRTHVRYLLGYRRYKSPWSSKSIGAATGAVVTSAGAAVDKAVAPVSAPPATNMATPPAPPTTTSTAPPDEDILGAIKTPLEEAYGYLPALGVVLGVLNLALVGFFLWGRLSIFWKEGR